jgi:hypothetical protein
MIIIHTVYNKKDLSERFELNQEGERKREKSKERELYNCYGFLAI